MWIDVMAAYWLAVKLFLYLSAVIIFISAIDDAIIDILYWVGRVRDWVRGVPSTTSVGENFETLPQSPIAVMVPAWQEAPVIARMAQLAADTFEYENYHIFIGTYPNDPDTQAAVDGVVSTYPNVHKVVTSRPGPTTKADCLNHVIESIFRFETEQGISFSTIAFHDAEDVIHPHELFIYNALMPDADLVQLPVFPLPRPGFHPTSGHYMDEFAESHGKDVPVRGWLTGNVPSAGVGTGFSRHAINTLFKLNGGQVFNTGSLTEDYDIGFQLHTKGMKAVFAHVPSDILGVTMEKRRPLGRRKKPFISVREYFPDKLPQAVRQKSRWIVGIVFQAWKTVGWPGGIRLKYILYRDRKALLTNPANCLAYYIVLNILCMELVTGLGDGAYWFPSLIPYDSWLWDLLFINGLFLLNRMAQRIFFVTRIYGIGHGLWSVPRMVWGNIINFMAFFRALRQVRAAAGEKKSVAWDKTDHEFPDMPSPNRAGGDE